MDVRDRLRGFGHEGGFVPLPAVWHRGEERGIRLDEQAIQRDIARDGAEIGVYHVGPNDARRGGLVVIQEIFGITDHIKAVSDGFADEGYEVLAPSLFDREEPGVSVGRTGATGVTGRSFSISRRPKPRE